MKMNRRVLRALPFAWILLVCLMISRPLNAQVAGATLSGVITDAQAGAVVNAKVSVTNLATSVALETVTNSAGSYTLPNLIPGDYEVSVTAQGFSTTKSKVTLSVGQKQEMNLALTVGQVSQEIQVTGAAPQVDLESSTISGEVGAATVRELPLNGRDWTSLAALEPGVATVAAQLDPTTSNVAGGRGLGTQMTISGSRPTQNSYRLDGAIVNDYSNAGPGSVLGKNLGVDAIQEFTVLTSNYSAEYGFTSGGVINAITRSGTNTFHGTAFDFVRNDKFDADNFFVNAGGLPKNPLRQNQFGAAGGWKILKDRFFLFGDYEGVRLSKGIPQSTQTTLTPAVKSGTVTNLFTGATTTVPVDANIQKYLGFWPAPSPNYTTLGGVGCLPLAAGQFSAPGVPGGCNPDVAKFIWLGNESATEDFYTFRSDFKISAKDSIFGTYLHDYSKLIVPAPLNNAPQEYDSWRQAVILEETHIFSSSVVNSLRVAYSRTTDFGGHSNIALNPLSGDASLAMAPGFFSPVITLTGAGVTSATSGLLYSGSVQDYLGQMYQIFDDAFVTKGNHGLKFGFVGFYQALEGYHPPSNGNGNGTFTYQGTYPGLPGGLPGGSTSVPTAAQAPCVQTGKSLTNANNYDQTCGTLVNFLTNQPRSAQQPLDLNSLPRHTLNDYIFGFYAQDDWRFRPNLTLNLGLRYEMSTIPTEAQGRIAGMPSNTTQLSPTNPTAALSNQFFTHNPTLLNFEPRLGFAWDPFHSGKTSVRGGFGMFDALPLAYEVILNSISTAPFRNARAVLGPPGNISPNAQAGAPDQFPFNIAALSAALPGAAVNTKTWYYSEQTPNRNYVYQYNLNIQRQITPNTTFLIGYVGSRGVHNPFQADSTNNVLPVNIGNPMPGVGYYWPGCFGAASATTAGQNACIAAGTAYTGLLTASQQQNRLLNPSVAGIPSTLWQSSSWYNALTVKLDKRLSRGFQVQGAFTWGKSIDDSSGSAAGDTFQFDYTSEPWYDVNLIKGLSDFNVGENLVINGLWKAPEPKTLGAIGDRVLGGWQLGLITELSSGSPVWPSITADMLGENISTVNPPNLVAGCSAQSLTKTNYRTSLFYINPSCLSLVPMNATNAAVCDQRLGASVCSNIRGDLGRNTITGPGLFNIDFSVFKNNYIPKISETANLQFRAEFFNVLNYTNFAPPTLANLAAFNSTGVASGTFGQLTSTQGQNRIIQLGLKLVW
jgi:Carboxypeptidase regulatory-like domain/TonB-dependent Receptor Plug Domain